uniref:DUF2304 domain-containing protein n=1 Tax=Agathobacter rectalis TaxID=39491 RepID=UPI004026B7F8
MTPVFRCVLILVSFCTLFGIVKKVRNAKIQIENTIFWIIFGFLLLLLSIFPQIASFAADILGIYSTTNFIFLFIIFVLLIHQFLVSVKCSQLENKIDELVQELAVDKKVDKEK